jgi:hypothetical protein
MASKIPDQCKTCSSFWRYGIKDGKNNRWCCHYGKPAAKAIGECKQKGGYSLVIKENSYA